MPEITTRMPDAQEVKKRVLICEDDQDVAALLKTILEHDGLDTDIAYDAAQAKKMLALHDYAAMTLDLGLPDQNGISLIRELRSARATANLPIIVISANADRGYKELQGDSGSVVDWINGTADHDQLVSALKQAILPLVVVSANGSVGRNELNGDTFCVVDWINKPIDQDQLEAALRQAMAQAPGTRPSVLYVDDELDMFLMLKATAGDFAEIENAPTLAAARRMLKNKRYDLAILDIVMPDGSGMELLPDLKSAVPPIPVMVLSAHQITQEAGEQVGASLVKSRTDNVQLLATIKRMVGVK